MIGFVKLILVLEDPGQPPVALLLLLTNLPLPGSILFQEIESYKQMSLNKIVP